MLESESCITGTHTLWHEADEAELTHYKTAPLRNLCHKLCLVYIPEWRPRQQCFLLVTQSFNSLLVGWQTFKKRLIKATVGWFLEWRIFHKGFRVESIQKCPEEKIHFFSGTIKVEILSAIPTDYMSHILHGNALKHPKWCNGGQTWP